LTERLEKADADGGGEIETAGGFFHRDAKAVRRILVEEGFGQAFGLATEYQTIAIAVFGIPEGSGGFGGQEPKTSPLAHPVQELRPGIPDMDVAFVPVIHPGASEGFFIEGKSEGSDEVEAGSRGEAKAGDVSGIGRNFRFDQRDVKHGDIVSKFLFPRQGKSSGLDTWRCSTWNIPRRRLFEGKRNRFENSGFVNGDDAVFASPTKGVSVVLMEKIEASGAFDRAATILDNAPTVSGHEHSRSKGIVAGIGRDGSVAGQESPRENDFERDVPWALEAVHGEKTGFRFAGFCSFGGATGVSLALAFAFGDVSVPKIELEVFPTAAFPFATGFAPAIGGGVHFAFQGRGAAGEENKEEDNDDAPCEEPESSAGDRRFHFIRRVGVVR